MCIEMAAEQSVGWVAEMAEAVSVVGMAVATAVEVATAAVVTVAEVRAATEGAAAGMAGWEAQAAAMVVAAMVEVRAAA